MVSRISLMYCANKHSIQTALPHIRQGGFVPKLSAIYEKGFYMGHCKNGTRRRPVLTTILTSVHDIIVSFLMVEILYSVCHARLWYMKNSLY